MIVGLFFSYFVLILLATAMHFPFEKYYRLLTSSEGDVPSPSPDLESHWLGWAALTAAAGPALALFALGFFTAAANKVVS